MDEKRRHDRGLYLLVSLAVLLLLALMVTTVLINSAASGTMYGTMPFSLSSLISDLEEENDALSMETFVNPAFIGLAPLSGSAGGVPEGLGISVGDNVSAELYRMLSPWLALGLAREGMPETDQGWEDALVSSRAVYIRYHSALPVAVLQAAAALGADLPVSEIAQAVGPVRELVLLLPDVDSGNCQVLLRDTGGQVWRYICVTRGEYTGYATVKAFANSFGSSFFRVTLRENDDGSREPVFLERLRVRNMLLAPGTAGMIQENRPMEYRTLLQQFDFNPDKLSTHEEGEGTQVTVEAHGILRASADRFVYTASATGGVALQHFIGYKETYSQTDCLAAACVLLGNLRSNYLGGDGEMFVTELSQKEDTTKIVIRYAFDNLLLEGCDPALVMEVRDNRVVSADMYALALRSLGNFDSSYLETGIWQSAPDTVTDVTLTYPVDFTSSNIYPEWTFYSPAGEEEAESAESGRLAR